MCGAALFYWRVRLRGTVKECSSRFLELLRIGHSVLPARGLSSVPSKIRPVQADDDSKLHRLLPHQCVVEGLGFLKK